MGQIWSPKALRTSVSNCEGKVRVTGSRLLGIEAGGITGGTLSPLIPWEVLVVTPGHYDWPQEVKHPCAKILIFPLPEIPLIRDQVIEAIERFAARCMRETEVYV